jgi:hypothetical protein
MNKKGFTIFFAMLVGSLALAVGFAIYDLTVREIDLSAAASQSQYAIFAADAGVECALYWDAKAPSLNGSPSIFATSTGVGNAATGGSGTVCNDQNIVTKGTPPTPFAMPTSGWSSWTVVGNASLATTTFTLAIPNNSTPAQTYCAIVEVGKATVGGVLYTAIVSRGYNTCLSAGVTRLERTLRVSY